MLAAGPSLNKNNAVNGPELISGFYHHAGCIHAPGLLSQGGTGGRDTYQPAHEIVSRQPGEGLMGDTCNGHCWSQEQTNKQWPNEACFSVQRKQFNFWFFPTKEIFLSSKPTIWNREDGKNIFWKNNYRPLSETDGNPWWAGDSKTVSLSNSCHYNWHLKITVACCLLPAQLNIWQWIEWAYTMGPTPGPIIYSSFHPAVSLTCTLASDNARVVRAASQKKEWKEIKARKGYNKDKYFVILYFYLIEIVMSGLYDTDTIRALQMHCTAVYQHCTVIAYRCLIKYHDHERDTPIMTWPVNDPRNIQNSTRFIQILLYSPSGILEEGPSRPLCLKP